MCRIGLAGAGFRRRLGQYNQHLVCADTDFPFVVCVPTLGVCSSPQQEVNPPDALGQ